MSNVSQYSTSAASNNSASPDGFPEGMAPSGVNDSARELMAALAKWYSDTDGSLTSGGSSNTYTLTSNSAHAALADQSIFVFRANHTNTGAATLNVDSLGAKAVQLAGAALTGGEIQSGAMVVVAYDPTDDAYDLVGGAALRVADNTFTGEANFDGPLALGDGSELTISTGSITPTANDHIVDTESDAATDDLDTIDDANMQEGALLLLRAANASRAVVVKNGTGNHKINMSGDSDFSLSGTEASVLLRLSGGEWYEVSRSVPGRVVQMVNVSSAAVQTTTTMMPADDTIPQSTEGTQNVVKSITPVSATNTLRIDVTMFVSASTGSIVTVGLFQDSTADALAAGGVSVGAGGELQQVTFTHWMTAGTTSSTTFKLRAGMSAAGTLTINGASSGRLYGGVAATSLTITEIQA